MKNWLALSVLVSAAAALVMAAVSPARQVLACSLAPANLEQSARHAEYVVVGEVTAERENNTGSPLPTLPEYARSYKSTVQVAAALKGDPPRLLTIDDLGQLGADCSGGPRLKEGERLLLFVSHYRSPVTGETDALYVPGYEGGKYALSDGYARSTYAAPGSFPVEEALRAVAAVAGSSSAQLDAALAFARGEDIQAETTTEDKASKPSATVIGLAAAGAVSIAGAGIVAFRRLRRTIRR